MNKKRKQTLGEEIGNAVTHGVAFFLSIAGLILLLVKANNSIEIVSLTFFGAGLMFVYGNSCLYHCFKHDSSVKSIWKRFDHASIYLLITSTFSPLLLNVVERPTGLIIFILQWSITFLGIAFKCIWPKKYHKLHIAFFLILGWSGLFYLPSLINYSLPLTYFILFGGVSYSVGVVFYAYSKRFKYFHFIWHFFVIIGSLLHFLGFYFYFL